MQPANSGPSPAPRPHSPNAPADSGTNPEASPIGDRARNLRVILTLAAVFIAMGLSLLVFLLVQRRRVQSGDYQGLESLLQTTPESLQVEPSAADAGGRSGPAGEMRPRPAARTDGAQAQPLGASPGG